MNSNLKILNELVGLVSNDQQQIFVVVAFKNKNNCKICKVG
jgi:hypothetical protein